MNYQYYNTQQTVQNGGANPHEGTIYNAWSNIPSATELIGGEVHKNSTVGDAVIFVGVTIGGPDTSGFWTSRWNTNCRPKKWECDRRPCNVQFGADCVFTNCNFVNGAEGICFGPNCTFQNCQGVADTVPKGEWGIREAANMTASACEGQALAGTRYEREWCKNIRPATDCCNMTVQYKGKPGSTELLPKL